MFRAIRSGDVDEVLRLLEADPTLLEKEGDVGYGLYGRQEKRCHRFYSPQVLASWIC
jgi:hypothetical protein